MLFIIFFLVFVLLLIFVILKYVKQYKIKPERILLFSGTMGSGKTLLATKKAFALRSRLHMILQLKRIWSYVKFWNPNKFKYDVPLIYSNIPLKSSYYRHLSVEMLLRREVMSENCIVLIDEFGGILADQYAWSNPYVVECLTEFVRFCRHWLDAYIIITDQTAEAIVKPVRDRLSSEYHLSHCRKWFHFWRIIDVTPVQHITSDVTNVIMADEDQQKYVFFWFNPRKSFYDTRCYLPSYRLGFVFDLKNNTCPKPLQTRYLYDLEPSAEDLKRYKSDKKSFRRELLSRALD